jgi:hypothetical protein
VDDVRTGTWRVSVDNMWPSTGNRKGNQGNGLCVAYVGKISGGVVSNVNDAVEREAVIESGPLASRC